jgi:hypothetical protein
VICDHQGTIKKASLTSHGPLPFEGAQISASVNLAIPGKHNYKKRHEKWKSVPYAGVHLMCIMRLRVSRCSLAKPFTLHTQEAISVSLTFTVIKKCCKVALMSVYYKYKYTSIKGVRYTIFGRKKIDKVWFRFMLSAIKVHLLCEPGYALPCVGILTKQKSFVNMFEFTLGV